MKLLLALLVKNNTQPGQRSSLVMMVVLLVVSVLDWSRPLPDELVVGALLLMVALGAAAGLTSFGADMKSQGLRFLEYLPISRSTLWLVNWLDGMWPLVLTTLLITWPRLINWSAPQVSDNWRGMDLSTYVSGERWWLSLGAMSLGVCACSIAVLVRLVVVRDASAMIYGATAGVLVTSGVWMLPGVLGITPRLNDAAVPLLLIALVQSAAAYAVYVLPPADWGAARRWLIYLPCLLLAQAVSLVLIAAMCIGWCRLSAEEPLVLGPHVPSDWAPGDSLLVTATSARSGPHLFRMEPLTGESSYVGRGLSPLHDGARLGGEEAPLLLRASVGPDRLTPRAWSVVAADARTGSTRDVFRTDTLVYGGQSYDIVTVMRSADPDILLVTAALGGEAAPRRRTDADWWLLTTDLSGRIRNAVAIGAGSIALGPDGKVLACAPVPQTGNTGASEAAESAIGSDRTDLIWIDPTTGQTRGLHVLGELVACSSDLAATASLVRSVQGNEVVQSLVVTDLDSGRERTLIGPEDLPRWRSSWRGGEPPMPWIRAADPLSGATVDADDVTIWLTSDLSRAVWRTDGDRRRAEYWTSDLSTALRLRMFDAEDIHGPDVPPASRWINEHGLSADGVGFVVTTGSAAWTIDLRSGARRLMAQAAEDSSLNWLISPRRTRVAGIVTRSGVGPAEEQRLYQYLYYWNGKPELLLATSAHAWVEWLGEDRLLVTSRGETSLINVADGQRRALTVGIPTADSQPWTWTWPWTAALTMLSRSSP